MRQAHVGNGQSLPREAGEAAVGPLIMLQNYQPTPQLHEMHFPSSPSLSETVFLPGHFL